MENPPLETPQLSQAPILAFPPHRRRPLKSHTYLTLVRFFSLCNDDSQHSDPVQTLPQDPKQGKVTEGGTLRDHDEHVDKPEKFVVQRENLDNESREVIDLQEKDCSHEVMEIDGVDCSLEVMEIDGVANMDVMRGNAINAHDDRIAVVNSLGNKNQTGDAVDAMNNNQQDYCCGSKIHMEKSGNIVSSKLDKDNSIDKVCHTNNTSLGIDLTAERSTVIENDKESSSVERNLSGDVERELQQKEMELEKLISGSCEMNSSVRATEDDEIEEGEFSGDPTVYSQLVELLFEDAVSLEKKIVDNVQISEGITDNKRTIDTEQTKALQRNTELTPLLVSTGNDVGNGMEVVLNEKSRNKMDNENNRNEGESKSGMLACGNSVEARKADDEAEKYERQNRQANCLNKSGACVKSLGRHDNIIGENATENQGIAEADAGVRNKEKKRGPSTKEKKARKKQRDRIKRAEKNRKLGVKRLKLKPVSKPKTVAYCHHYLKGRCKEGEKCKFSHDTIPLTKSMPCCHFARHSCMKGDDCPFDHQLSKYPCNNFLSKGFCSRGADCLFSHEVLVRNGSSLPPMVSQPELSSLSPLGNSNTDKKLKLQGIHNADAKTCAIGVISCKRTEQNGGKHMLESTAEIPKGVSFFSQGSSSVNDSNRNKQVDFSKKVDDRVKVDHQIIMGAADVTQNSKEITKKTAVVVPKGINFLAFGKAPSNNSSSKKPVSLPFNKDCGVRNSPFSDSGNGKLGGLSPKRDDVVKVDNETGQTASDVAQNLNEISNRKLPTTAPRGINFLAFSNAALDSSFNKKQAGLQCSPNIDVPLPTDERQSTPNKHQSANTVPWRLPSFLSSTRFFNQLADGHVKSTQSSSQASHQSNTSSTVQKALQSTLACATKFDSEIKNAQFVAPDPGGSENKSMKSLKILDFIYGGSSRTNHN